MTGGVAGIGKISLLRRVAIVLLLSAAGMMLVREFIMPKPSEPPLADLGSLPAFSLVDQDGQAVTAESLAGRVWVASFIFTRCAGQCPMITMRMHELAQKYKATDDVTLVSISVDPQNDTPGALKDYAQQLKAPPSWRFFTGEPAAVQALVAEGFRLSVSEDGTAEEPITHSMRLALVDQRGHRRGYYDAMEPSAMVALSRDIERLRGGRAE